MEKQIYPVTRQEQESLKSVIFNKYGLIYKFTNNLDGKIYIGQTTKKLNIRIRQHRCTRASTCSFLSRAIKVYGIHNFLIEEIYISFDKEDLNEKEIFFIKFFNSKAPVGYNLTDGGETSKGLYFSEEAKQKASKLRNGKEVVAINIKSKEVRFYDYVAQTKKDNFRNADVYRNLNNKTHQIKGWKFYYKTDYDNLNGSTEIKNSEHVQRLESDTVNSEYNLSKRPRFPKKLNHIDQNELIDQYEKLNSCYKVAEFFNVDKDSILRALKSLGKLKNQSDAATLRNLRKNT